MTPIPINKSPVASKTRSSASKKNIDHISPIRKVKHSKKKKDFSPSAGKRKDPNSTPVKIPILHYKPKDTELDSSPIKRNQDNSSQPSPVANLVSSSPIKKKKCVAFSDDLFSDIPVTPEKILTPKRPILKYYKINTHSSPTDPNNTALWENSTEEKAYGPKNPAFWLQGTIIQLQPNSSELAYLIEGCVEVLRDNSFNRRFEVYATLNGICKSTPKETLIKLFTNVSTTLSSHTVQKTVQECNIVVRLSSQIKKDIESTEDQLFNSELDKENVSPSKNDPFRIRIINQGLKLINFFISDQDFNNFLPIDNISWFYRHACTLLRHPKTSKAIVSPYLLLIKDCKFSMKKKRLIFDNSDIPENMLYSLINMKPFLSASIVTEKFLCLKNFVLNFPNIMAKNIAHWFGFLIWNIFDVTSPFYFKCLGVGINCLLVVAKAFLDNKNVSIYVRRFLSSEVPSDFTEQSETSNIKTIDVITKKLEELILTRQYKHIMDIWLALTLLVGDGETSFDKWEYLNKWLQIPKYCFNSQDENARLLVLGSWKAVAFNICRNELSDMKKVLDPIFKIPNLKERHQAVALSLKSKARLLTYLFGSFNASEVQNEVVDAMHNLFICILYLIINPQIMKQSTKYMHIYWDKIIQIVFLNFYFKKGTSTPHMNQLGLKILGRLLKPATPINERNFNEIRCLSIDPVLLTEINSFPSRWIHSKFDRIMQSMILVFQSENLYIEQKVNFFNSFLASIRSVTKNEVNVSPITYDIIDNIPLVLGILFENNKFTYDLTLKLVLNLHDTFDPSLLVNRTRFENGDISTNVYLSLFQNCLPRLSNEESMELFSLIIQSLSSQKVLIFIADLCKLDISEGVRNLFIDVLNKRKVETTEMELGLYNGICGNFHRGFDIFVKKLIQSIVSLTDSDELKRCLGYIRCESWSIAIRMYFLLLIKGAPNNHVQQYTISILENQLNDQEMLVTMIQFLTEQNFEVEIAALVPQIMKAITSTTESLQNLCIQALDNYLLLKIKESEPNFELIDKLVVSCYTELNMMIEDYLTVDLSKLPLLAEELNRRGLSFTNGKLISFIEYPGDELVDPALHERVPELERVEESAQVNNEKTQEESKEQVEKIWEQSEVPALDEKECKQPLEEQTIKEAVSVVEEFIAEAPESVNSNIEVPNSLDAPSNKVHEEQVVDVTDSLELAPVDKNTLVLREAEVVVSNTLENESSEMIKTNILVASDASKSKKKDKSKTKTKGRKKKSVKVKKESDSICDSVASFNDSIPNDTTFDIHTFTAVLNAKLSSDEVYKTHSSKIINDSIDNVEQSVNQEVASCESSSDSFPSSQVVPDSFVQDSTPLNSQECSTSYVNVSNKRKHDEDYDNKMQKKRKLSDSNVDSIEAETLIPVVSKDMENSGTIIDTEKIEEKVLFPVPCLESDTIQLETTPKTTVQEGAGDKDESMEEVSVDTSSPENNLVLNSVEISNTSNDIDEKECGEASSEPKETVEQTSVTWEEPINTTQNDKSEEDLQVSSATSESIVTVAPCKDIQVPVQQTNIVSSLVEQLHCISDTELSNLTSQEKYDIETQLLGLMLRLRNSR